jgi:SAM-dependent methyltransferase
MSIFRRLFFSWLYLGKPRWDTGVSPPELLAFIESYPPGKALDLGCGTGTNVITLAQAGWQVIGIDFVPTAIHQARSKATRLDLEVELRVGDAVSMKGLPGPYDLVLDMGCFHGLEAEERRRYIDNLVVRLAPGGFYLLYGFISSPEISRRGITQEDLDYLEARLELVNRTDGFDRARKASVWLTYRRK